MQDNDKDRLTIATYSDQCEECLGKTIEENGFVVCMECGLINEKLLVSSDPQSQMAFTDRNHRENRKNIYVGELGSYIFPQYHLMNQGISPETARKFRRLERKYQMPLRISEKQTHVNTIKVLKRIFAELEIGEDLQEKTLRIYWKAVNQAEQKITNHILLGSLSLLIAVRNAGRKAPYTLEEIIQAFQARGHRVSNKSLLRLAQELRLFPKRAKRKSEDYLPRFVGMLKQNKQIQAMVSERYGIPANRYFALLERIASTLLQLVRQRSKSSARPFGLAATAIYGADRVIASTLHKQNILTQEMCNKVLGVSQFTIRDHSYRLFQDLYKIVRKQVKEQITPRE